MRLEQQQEREMVPPRHSYPAYKKLFVDFMFSSKFITFFISIFLLLSLSSCKKDAKEIQTSKMLSAIESYHQNYNAENFTLNYSMFPVDARAGVSLDRYLSDSRGIKEKLGRFIKGELAATDHTQKTTSGKEAISIIHSSTFEKSGGIEIFTFIEGPILYRYELKSTALIEKKI